jgi:hypothetical protein
VNLSQALAESLRPFARLLPLKGKDDPVLRAAPACDVVEELMLRETGRTGQLPLPTRRALLEEITARLIADETRQRGHTNLRQRVAKRWHHVMEKKWLPLPLPEMACASEIVRLYRASE